MAVLNAPLDPVTIASLKGTLDYYLWRGIPVVRSWPKRPTMPRSAPVTAAYEDFKLTSQLISVIPIELQNAAHFWTDKTAWTWKDLWTAATYGNLYAQTPSALPEVSHLMPPLIPGSYYGMPATTAALTTLSTATGTIRAVPFFVPAQTDFDRLAIEITATTTGTIRLALYGPIVQTPANAALLIDSGTLTPAGTGLLQYTIGQGLAPGWYLLAYQTSLTRTVRAVAVASQLALLGQPTGAATAPASWLTLTQAYGPFPNTLGAGTTYQIGAIAPNILIRAM